LSKIRLVSVPTPVNRYVDDGGSLIPRRASLGHPATTSSTARATPGHPIRTGATRPGTRHAPGTAADGPLDPHAGSTDTRTASDGSVPVATSPTVQTPRGSRGSPTPASTTQAHLRRPSGGAAGSTTHRLRADTPR